MVLKEYEFKVWVVEFYCYKKKKKYIWVLLVIFGIFRVVVISECIICVRINCIWMVVMSKVCVFVDIWNNSSKVFFM